MSSLIEKLVELGKLRREAKATRHVAGNLAQAAKSVVTARRNLEIDPDWALAIAYAAALQAGLALVHSRGVRTGRGEGQHETVIQVVRDEVTELPRQRLAFFDLLRRQRHRVQYEPAGGVTRRQADQAVEFAEELVTVVTARLAPKGDEA